MASEETKAYTLCSTMSAEEWHTFLTEAISAIQADKKEEAIQMLQSHLDTVSEDTAQDEKSTKYDALSTQIGDIILNANATAEKILASANAEAARTREDSETEATYIRTRLSESADEMLAKISSELHTSTEACMTELQNAMNEIEDSVSNMLRDFARRRDELQAKIDYFQSTVSETVEASLQELDTKYGIRPSSKKSVKKP